MLLAGRWSACASCERCRWRWFRSFCRSAVAGWALAAWAVGPDDPVPSTSEPGPVGAARVELADGHTVVWSGRTPVSTVILIIATVLVMLGLVIGWTAGWFILPILGPVAAVLVGTSMYRITIGPNGLRVAGLLLGFPRVNVALPQIASAEAGSVSARSFGGWGLRLRANGESAVIIRSGPALVVRRTDGASLRVSLDSPEQAAAVITTLLDRR